MSAWKGDRDTRKGSGPAKGKLQGTAKGQVPGGKGGGKKSGKGGGKGKYGGKVVNLDGVDVRMTGKWTDGGKDSYWTDGFGGGWKGKGGNIWYKPKPRFDKMDRVVCFVGGEHSWVPGSIQALEEDDPQEPGETLPYVVKVDAPLNRLISVPEDVNSLVCAERCFGQRAGALFFTLFCLPQRFLKPRRFVAGDRVACAVEDDTDDYTAWAAGTVIDVDYSIEEDAKKLMPQRDFAGDAGLVPYRVELDKGAKVLVHRDDHSLVRDLALQDEGPRQGADGTRNMKRMVKRRAGDAWEVVDHTTRQVRPADSDSDDDD